MAAWHGRAVMAQRDKYKDEISYNLALSVALHMGNDESSAMVAIKTLAAEAHCHYNTADKRTKQMEADGLLIIERDGNLLSYRIPGDFENQSFVQSQPKTQDHTDEIERINTRLDNLEKKVDDLHTIVTKLSHDLHMTFTRASHGLHTGFTPPVYENVNKVVEVVEEENIYTHPREAEITLQELPPGAVPFDEIDQRQEMVSAVSQEVKQVFATGITENEFNMVADGLIARGIKPEQIKGFSEWWEDNGFYPGKPSLKSLLAEIGNYLNGVKRKPDTPKDSGEIISAWQEVKAVAGNGQTPEFSNERIKRAISPLWPQVKTMTSYTERDLKTQFERNYNAIN